MARHRVSRSLRIIVLGKKLQPVGPALTAAVVIGIIGAQGAATGSNGASLTDTSPGTLRVLGSDPVPSRGHSTPTGPSPVVTQTPISIVKPMTEPDQSRPASRSANRSSGRRKAARVDLSSILATAESYAGVPYVWGGETPSGFDCSGYVQWVYSMHGVRVPRTAEDQRRFATTIGKAQLRPGDLIFFLNASGEAYHVGIYAGGWKIWAAPKPGDHVRLESIWSTRISFGRFA